MTSFSFKPAARLVAELGVLLALYLLGNQLSAWLHWPIPGGVIGMAMLLLVFASGWVKPATLQAGAGLLMAEMLLFFVPAVVAVVNYQDLLLQEGWRIMVVLVTSTVLVLGTTALVVDRVYRLELKLARRSRRHV